MIMSKTYAKIGGRVYKSRNTIDSKIFKEEWPQTFIDEKKRLVDKEKRERFKRIYKSKISTTTYGEDFLKEFKSSQKEYVFQAFKMTQEICSSIKKYFFG